MARVRIAAAGWARGPYFSRAVAAATRTPRPGRAASSPSRPRPPRFGAAVSLWPPTSWRARLPSVRAAAQRTTCPGRPEPPSRRPRRGTPPPEDLQYVQGRPPRRRVRRLKTLPQGAQRFSSPPVTAPRASCCDLSRADGSSAATRITDAAGGRDGPRRLDGLAVRRRQAGRAGARGRRRTTPVVRFDRRCRTLARSPRMRRAVRRRSGSRSRAAAARGPASFA